MFILGPTWNIFSQKTEVRAWIWENTVIYKSFINKLNVYNHKEEPSPIFSTWSLNFSGGMPLVKGSTIINSVLMCLMTTTFSLMAKYLMAMCLLRLPLSHNSNWIIAENFHRPKDRIHYSKPINKTLKPYTMSSCLKTGDKLGFHSRNSNQSLFSASPWNSGPYLDYSDIFTWWTIFHPKSL